jgi:hypothetical protein
MHTRAHGKIRNMDIMKMVIGVGVDRTDGQRDHRLVGMRCDPARHGMRQRHATVRGEQAIKLCGSTMVSVHVLERDWKTMHRERCEIDTQSVSHVEQHE